MMAKKHMFAAVALAGLLAGCGSGGDATPTASDTAPATDSPTTAAPAEITGDLTVITWRTDLVDNVFQDYKAQFEAKYPGVNVTFEAITDYEGEISIRLNTDDYGDVLAIPNTVKPDQLSQFFVPLGTVEELEKDYRYVKEQSFEGTVYGIAVVGNAQGIVYNKNVWEEAGITDLPTTPAEFLEDLQAIKDNTDAIPYYTNYKDGWPMSQWEGNRGISGDPAASIHFTQIDDPWAADEYHGIVDGLLFDIVAQGLSEDDPLTTNWEESKNLIGTGQVATMLLGSWAITQMQDAAVAAGGSADDIGYMPFPYQADGTFYSTSGGDYKQAISVHSDNQEAARAWIDWFNNESGFAVSQGGIPVTIGSDLPPSLSAFQEAGVEFIEMDRAPAGQESLENDIANEAEIDLWGNVYRQKLVDIARGAADGTKESYFEELNARWAAARAAVS